MKKLLFESVICSRCCGEGIFRAYLHIQGGRCFKCNGTGEILTRRGSAAQAFLNTLRLVAVETLLPGDLYYDPGFTCGDLNQPTKWRKVAAISCLKGANPNEPEQVAVSLVFEDGHALQSWVGAKVRKGQTAEQKAANVLAALEYQKTLTKTGSIKKHIPTQERSN